MKDDHFFGFDKALKHLKEGKRVARAGWHGGDIWLGLIRANKSPSYVLMDMLGHFGIDSVDDLPAPMPWIGLKTSPQGFVPWTPGHADLLADDWEVVKE